MSLDMMWRTGRPPRDVRIITSGFKRQEKAGMEQRQKSKTSRNSPKDKALGKWGQKVEADWESGGKK